jgi:hypothetical protein
VLLVGLSLALPDLDRLRELLRRIQEILALGGVALATVASLLFVLVWAASFLRSPRADAAAGRPWLSGVALVLAYGPVALTLVAAAGLLVPPLATVVLKAFALAVCIAAVAWCAAVAAILAGGTARDLARARRALLLAGTPWYCLVVFLATYL